MVLRKLSQSLKISMAMVLSVLSTNILTAIPVSAANAGFIQIREVDNDDSTPQNDPMLESCSLALEFYNFDNTQDAIANVTFETQAPTAAATVDVLAGDTTPTIEGDGYTGPRGSNDLDGDFEYTLGFTGEPKTEGNTTGYKVKVTAEVDGINPGNKTKVFWMPATCATTTTNTTPLPSGINDVCGPNNDTVPVDNTDTYTVTSDTKWVNGSRTITYEAADGLVFSESDGWTVAADGKTATYTYTDWATPCGAPVECDDPADGGIITDKTPNWTLVGDAEFVDGAVSINSDNWNDGGVSFTDKYPVAEVQKLDWDLDTNGATGAVGVGILLENENHDVIHYEPGVYTDDFWSNDPVLPANGGGQGGPYSGSLQDLLDTIGNVNIIKTTFVFTSAEANEGVLLTSLSFNCTDYTFDKAPRVPTECSVRPNSFTKEWTYDNATYPDAADYSYVEGETIVNNATYEFNANGLHISTPDTDSSVYGLIDAGSTPIQDVDKMSYDTYRKAISEGYASTQPAYILVVDTNGAEADGEAYFFYEPYNNSSAANTENTWLHWDAFDGGNAKWWMTGTGQALHTWDYFVEQYPDAIVLAYGFNQGTSNAETYAIVQNLEFDCATTTFGSGNVNGDEDDNETETPPTNTGGGQGGGNVLGDSTGKVTPQVLGASTGLPATIPATGNASNPFIILVASLAAYGAAYFAQGRRNLGQKASLDL